MPSPPWAGLGVMGAVAADGIAGGVTMVGLVVEGVRLVLRAWDGLGVIGAVAADGIAGGVGMVGLEVEGVRLVLGALVAVVNNLVTLSSLCDTDWF